MRRYLTPVLTILFTVLAFSAITALPASAASPGVNHSHQCKSTGFHSGYQGVICFDFYSRAGSSATQLLHVDVEALCTNTSGVDVQCRSAIATWTASWQIGHVIVPYGPSAGRCVPSGPPCSNTRTLWTGTDDNQPINNGYCGIWKANLSSTGFTFPNNVQAGFSNWTATVPGDYCTGD
jgi:hypothetical protein